MTKSIVARSSSILWCVFALNAVFAIAQGQQPRITGPLDDTATVRIAQSHHPLAVPANDRGRIDGFTAMRRMVLVFKPADSQASALARLIDGQHDKQSAAYHTWLTPEQFGNQFGPAQQDLDQVTAWLQKQGFSIDGIARGRQWIEFSGTAAQVETAFHTEMHHYSVKGEDHIANSGDISLPQALTPVVSGVLSLHNFRAHSTHAQAFQLRRDPQTKTWSRVAELVPDQHGVAPKPSADFTLGASTHFLTPGDYSRIYNTLPLLNNGIDGTGVSIAIVGRTDINLSDVQTFRQIFGLPANDPEFIVNGADPGVNGDEVESALDVEWAGAVAPKATIKFVTTESTFTTDGVSLSTSYIVDNLIAPIMSTSYSLCEAFLGTAGNAFFNSMYQQAAAEGITSFVSTGDNGPAACDSPVSFTPAQNGPNVSGLASTPYNVAVGGTEFNERGQDATYWQADNRADLSSAVGYIPEKVWNESCDPTVDQNQCQGTGLYFLEGGSGGSSSCTQSTVSGFEITCLSGYPKPSWQAGRGVVADGARDIPDLSLAAAGGHDGYLLCVEGTCQTTEQNGQTVLLNAAVVGGTSASTPSMAGMMALVEQKNGTFQGLANYSFYQLAAKEKLSDCNSSKLTDPNAPNNCVFFDVTAGNNNVPGQVGFNAVWGYDMGTGLGTVNASNLVSAWSSAAKLGSATSLSGGANTIQHGAPLPLNVAVSAAQGNGAPTGDFSIVSDTHGSVLGGTLANGIFSGGVNGLEGGHYNIKAHYGGDAMFSGSDSPGVPVTITPEPSTTTAATWVVNLAGFVVPYYGPVFYGEPVAIQFNPQGKSGVGAATGNATIILDDQVNLGTFPVNQGGGGWAQVDNITHTGLVPGWHSFKVSYSGDNSFQPSVSSRLGVMVNRVLPNGFAAPIPDTVTVGTPVRLIFAVLSEGVLAPTGTINLYDNGKMIAGPIELQHQGLFGAGLAQISYTATGLKEGFHEFKLTYSGDTNHVPLPLFTFSNHGAFVTVNAATGAATHVTLSPSAGTVPVGGTVNYAISVKPTRAGAPLPTGTVTLVGENGGTFGDSATLINGNASISYTWVTAFPNGITAAYSGDSNYSASNSPVIITSVKQGVPTVTLTAASANVAAGTQTSVSVSTVGLPSNPNVSLPYGQVVFTDSVDGGPEHKLGSGFLTTGNGGNPFFTLPVTLSKGSHQIRAKYLGSFDWLAAESNIVVVVAQ